MLGTGASSRIFILCLVATVCLLQSRALAHVDQDDHHDKDHLEPNDPLPTIETSTVPVETCDGPLCVRKCCPAGEHFEGDLCTPIESSPWTPTKFVKDRKDVGTSKLQVIFGLPPRCGYDIDNEIVFLGDDTFRLLPDGNMLFVNHNISEPPSHYCLENRQDVDGEIALFCNSPVPTIGICYFHTWLYPILMSISSFFLILTLAVYGGVPKLRQRTYGRCLISLVVALFIFYIMQISNFIRDTLDEEQCLVLAFFSHWNGLAIFFWLNVMAFELWRTVRSRTPVVNDMKKFMIYSLYAWGIPLLIATITIIIDRLPASFEIQLRPNLGERFCFLEEWAVRWAYLYWVILMVTVVNLGFFVDICYNIYKVKQQVQKRENNFWMFLKMFLIIGTTWIIDIFSTRECLWVIGDLPNLLQGVIIFIATVCNKNVMKEVVNSLSPRFRGLGEFWQDVRQRISPSCAAPSSYGTGTRATALNDKSSEGERFSQNISGQANYGADTADIPLKNMSSFEK